jgi:AcrR family transcriptional regulator
MYKKSIAAKENIMLAFIKLISKKDIEQISIHEIAKEAGVAVGLINYHFKTKENLFNMAIEYYIVKTIQDENKQLLVEKIEPKEQLKASLYGFADFLRRHEKISRLYIMNSLNQTKTFEMTQLGYDHYIPIARSIFKEKSDKEIFLIIYPIISTIQMMFLKRQEVKKAVDIDFLVEIDIHLIIDSLIDRALKLS